MIMQELSGWRAAGIVGLQLAGYALFRGSNSQKNRFRQDPTHPSVAGLQTLPTKRGTCLITSGWWGLVRHPNYLGDWMMACVFHPQKLLLQPSQSPIPIPSAPSP